MEDTEQEITIRTTHRFKDGEHAGREVAIGDRIKHTRFSYVYFADGTHFCAKDEDLEPLTGPVTSPNDED